MLNPSGHVHVTVQIDGQRGLVDDGLHAGDSEVVVAVVKPGVDQAFFAEAEDLPACQGPYEEVRVLFSKTDTVRCFINPLACQCQSVSHVHLHKMLVKLAFVLLLQGGRYYLLLLLQSIIIINYLN